MTSYALHARHYVNERKRIANKSQNVVQSVRLVSAKIELWSGTRHGTNQCVRNESEHIARLRG